MANLNINAGQQGNPLDALLNGRPQYGNLGGLLQAQFSSAPTGEGGYALNPNDGYIWGNDPRFQGAYSALQNYNGKGEYSQLRNTTIGGPGGVIDPSQVTYDPQYGLVTPRANLNPLGQGTFWDRYGGLILMAPVAASAIAGLSGASGAAGAAGDISTSDLGALGTVNGEGAAAAGAAGSAGGAASSSGGLLGSLGNSASGLLGQAGSWAMSNPLQAAGLLQTAYGLLGHHSAPSSGGSSKGGNGSGTGNGFNVQQQFYTNPTTLAQLQRYQAGGY